MNNLVISYFRDVVCLASSSAKSSSSSEKSGEISVPRNFCYNDKLLDCVVSINVFCLKRLFDAIFSSLLVGKNLVMISLALSIKLTSSTVMTFRFYFMY